ncbi:MAG TPA: bacteriohopanetetrol glucosamine biosynthesis glycosyltransferase HpnI [Candidatus Acidoferrales bacterium]|nr:bacteriohopanetetrol glucosamine biosynthesis glycosyltransferase HpnI [Candidatus Acidoferrales bacterium]
MIWLAALPALAAAAYYLLVIVASVKWGRGPRAGDQGPGAAGRGPGIVQPLSILKPVHGRDPQFYEAIFSHAAQEYPEFEILFGCGDPADPAMEDIRRLTHEFPQRRIEVAIVPTGAPNAKVGVLAELAKRARYPLLLVNDSDIVVEPGYLMAVTAPLADPGIGLVTCLYRGAAESWAGRLEALGIATEFAPSVLVARLLGVAEFALGSTMVFRAEALRRIGGFEAIANYLADDYQLGRHISQLGYRIVFAPFVVETDLGAESWAQTWRHQLRWSRTIRVSRPSGYYGYGVTHATVWALVAMAAGYWGAGPVVIGPVVIGLAAFGLRMLAGVLVGAVILKDRNVFKDWWLIPLRDLLGFAVWVAGLFGNRVQWRDRELRLRPDGRIVEEARLPAPSLQR